MKLKSNEYFTLLILDYLLRMEMFLEESLHRQPTL